MKFRVGSLLVLFALGPAACGSDQNSQTSNASTVTNLKKLKGTYEVTSDLQEGIINILKIEANGKLTLKENSLGETIVCTGVAKVVNDSIKAKMECENGLTFTQSVTILEKDYTKDKFKAEVESSLYEELGINGAVVNTFKKISD